MSIQSQYWLYIIRSMPANHPKRISSKVKRPLKAIKGKSVFISGGIGDVIAIESHLSDQERERLTSILYGTSKHAPIRQLLASLPNFSKQIEHKVVWDDFDHFWCFFRKEECISRMIITRRPHADLVRKAEDYGICTIFDKIKRGQMKFYGSSLLKHAVDNIDRLSLPEKFLVICPYSTDKRIVERDFSDQDWGECLTILKNRGIQGVVLYQGDCKVPDDPSLIDLSNKTTLTESVEIVKKASGYVGIDSWLSVLAAQRFDQSLIQVKCLSRHCLDNALCYFGPKSNYSFLVPKLDVSLFGEV